MHELPQSRDPREDAAGLMRNSLRRSGAKALLAAGLMAAATAPMISPAFAQQKADAPGIETPFGRAPLTFADIIAKVKPSVVSISVVGGSSKKAGPMQQPEIPEDIPPQLRDFFKNFKGMPNQGQPKEPSRPTQAQGSGFVISHDGFVVTNNHVIEGATRIQVSFDDLEKLDAELVGTDPRTDLALIKIKGTKTDYPHVNFSTKEPRVGDWALAVGNPFGLGGTVTAGIVSALARDIGSGPYDYMQIDAAVNRGNSGGPTFNLEGEVIGINTAIFSPSGGNVGIAFDVPARTATPVIEALKTKGTVARGWLGVKIQNMDEDAASSLGLTEAKGALVGEVLPNSPAGAAGIKRQDVIVAVNGQKINNSRELSLKIAEIDPNTSVDVKYWRSGKEDSLKVKLGTFPSKEDEVASGGGKPDQEDSPVAAAKEIEGLGLKLSADRGGASDGVAIAEVDDDSNAAQKGLKPGDVILEVNGEAVSSPTQVQEQVKKVKDAGRTAVMLYVQSGDQKVQLAVPFTKKG